MKLEKLMELAANSENENLDLLAASCRVPRPKIQEVEILDEEKE